jgi:hypothetical protein
MALYRTGGTEIVTGTQTNQDYSWKEFEWFSGGGNGTINFYDEVAANYAGYFRSGYGPFRTAARQIGDVWPKMPSLDEYWQSTFPRNIGALGTVANAVLDGRTQQWYYLRRLATTGVGASSASCSQSDTRENAYSIMWLAFAAMFDPLDTGNPLTPGQKSYWKAQLDVAYARDNSCKSADNSYKSAFYFNYLQFPAVVLTNGQTTVTGSGFTSNMCNRTAGGTGTITTGTSALTIVTGTPVYAYGSKILLTGVLAGQPYNVYFESNQVGAVVTLSGNWPGDGGTVTWQTESDINIPAWSNTTTVGPGNPGAVHGCTYNSPTSLTLSSPWQGSSTTDGRVYRGNLSGEGQQPFIAGIKVLQQIMSSQGAIGASATGFNTLAQNLAAWVINVGYDPVNGGMKYGAVFPMCTPELTQGGWQGGFANRAVGCTFAATNYTDSRGLLAEAQSALRLFYTANPTVSNKAIGDDFYGNQWGGTLTSGGVTTTSWQNAFATDQSLNVGKWYGFQFGIGMAHQWPAVRLGGVAPQALTTKSVKARLADHPLAVSMKMTLTWPTGATASATCTSAACAISWDSRQGNSGLLTTEYYDGAGGTGKRLALGTQVITGL